MKTEKQIKDMNIDISINEFDNMNDIHVFSKSYEKKKKKIIKQYRAELDLSHKNAYVKAAVAVVLTVLLISLPFGVNALTDDDMYSRIWGSAGKKDIESHEVEYDEKGTTHTFRLPERNYVDVDVEKAEKLIGEYVSYPSIKMDIAGTTLTILSAVTDGSAAVVEYTLEKKGGVDALHYSALSNEGKGAMFSKDSTFSFVFQNSSDTLIVDLDKSTKEKVYCYDFLILSEGQTSLFLTIEEYPCTISEMMEACDSIFDERYKEILLGTSHKGVTIPIKNKVPFATFKNSEGGLMEISSISMSIDRYGIQRISKEDASEAGNINFISVNYKDGTNYIVESYRDGEYIMNYNYCCSSSNGWYKVVLNRLVDIDEIESITINESTYMRE